MSDQSVVNAFEERIQTHADHRHLHRRRRRLSPHRPRTIPPNQLPLDRGPAFSSRLSRLLSSPGGAAVSAGREAQALGDSPSESVALDASISQALALVVDLCGRGEEVAPTRTLAASGAVAGARPGPHGHTVLRPLGYHVSSASARRRQDSSSLRGSGASRQSHCPENSCRPGRFSPPGKLATSSSSSRRIALVDVAGAAKPHLPFLVSEEPVRDLLETVADSGLLAGALAWTKAHCHEVIDVPRRLHAGRLEEDGRESNPSLSCMGGWAGNVARGTSDSTTPRRPLPLPGWSSAAETGGSRSIQLSRDGSVK